jgi:hypothetical protein
MCHERKILELMLWLSKHLVIILEHKLLLIVECFALEAPVGSTHPTGLTGNNSQTDVADRSDRSRRFGSVHGTGLTDAHDRSVRSPGEDSSSVFLDKNEVEY